MEYLQAENRSLREQLGKKRIRWTDAQRHRLAEKAKAIGRSGLRALDTIVTPDTLLRWYRNLVAATRVGVGRFWEASSVGANVLGGCSASTTGPQPDSGWSEFLHPTGSLRS